MTVARKPSGRSVFTNLIVALTLGPAFLVILIGLWSSYDIARDIRAELINQINDDVAALTEIYTQSGQDGLLKAIEQREALSPINRSGATYLAIAPAGDILGGSLRLGGQQGLHISQTVSFKTGSAVYTARATQLRNGERLIIARDHSPISRALHANMMRFALAVLTLLLLSYFLAKHLSRDLGLRVENMNSVFKAVGDGTLDARLDTDCRGDEVSLLGDNINAMLERTERIIKLRKRVSDQLAHEMRTPLTRLDNTLQRLKTSPATDDARMQLRRCVEMLDGLLDISALDAQYGDRRGFQRYDLNAQISALVELFEPVAEDGQKHLSWQPHEYPVTIAGDPAQIGRLLSNLIENALKYSDPKTNIMLRLDKDDPAFARHAVVRISNIGPTISEATAKDIFTPFFRAPDMVGSRGYGLGLALCRAIAQRHNGQVDFEPHPRSTVFRFNLPLA